VILIDTPAAQLYADAQNVAYRAGDALMVARKDHTRLAETSKTIRDLSGTGARVVGAVMNTF
jgi:Mrp family chromosome partitioning ATPase